MFDDIYFCKPAAGNEDGFLTLILGRQVLLVKVGGPQISSVNRKSAVFGLELF